MRVRITRGISGLPVNIQLPYERTFGVDKYPHYGHFYLIHGSHSDDKSNHPHNRWYHDTMLSGRIVFRGKRLWSHLINGNKVDSTTETLLKKGDVLFCRGKIWNIVTIWVQVEILSL